jgi:hypothetical protein
VLWLGITKGSTNLSLDGGPNQARSLREDVDQSQNGTNTSVKEVYLAIVRASAYSQEGGLSGRKCKGFGKHCRGAEAGVEVNCEGINGVD